MKIGFQNELIALQIKRSKTILFVVVMLILFSFIFSYSVIPAQPLLANGDDHGHVEETSNKNLFSYSDVESIKTSSVQIVKVASITLLILIFIAVLTKNRKEYLKKVIFTSIVIIIIVPTVYFISSTIYINLISETGGPVHWHADYRIFSCEEELYTASPEGKLSNKTGTSVLHEHDDQRVHVEGVLINKEDASLSNFFAVQGGLLTDDSFTIPTNEGMKQFTNGDFCSGEDTSSMWQVFLYKTDGNFVEQTKLENYKDYILTPANTVPPGDCIIFEFGAEKDKTDNICNFYTLEINKGNLELK